MTSTPTIDEQEGEPTIGPEDSDEEVEELDFEADGELEQVFQILEAFHGRAVGARSRQGLDRIRELEVIAEENAYLTALQVLATALEEEDVMRFIDDPQLASRFQQVSQQARGYRGEQES